MLVLGAAALVAVPAAPVFAAPLPLVQVSAGGYFTCALAPSGLAYCWGLNSTGELGDGTNTSRTKPVPVQQTSLNFSSISTGNQHACGLTPAGQAYCWGLNGNGQLGDGTTTNRSTPVAVQQSGTVFASIAAGRYETCGLTALGAVWCWGFNTTGGIGDGTFTERHVPTAVQQGALVFTALAVGADHTCGLTSAGAAWCWGWNGNGQLGDSTGTNRSTPVAVQQGVLSFASIAATTYTTCGLTSAGQTYCWGYNGTGAFGNNSTSGSNTPVATTQGGITFASITLGAGNSCGLTSGGVAYCWGQNLNGQVGNNSTTMQLLPTAVNGGLTFSSLTSAETAIQACGVQASTQLVYCWGGNTNGQLGDNTNIDKYVPTQSWYLVTASGTTDSVTIDPSFTFTVSGLMSSTCNGVSSTTDTSAMTNTVSFGHIAAGTRKIGAQNLQVATNAGGGYVVYMRSAATSANVLKGSGLHSIADAGSVVLPAAGNEFFGYNTDATGSGVTSGNLASVPQSPSGLGLVGAGSSGTGTANCVIYALGISASTPADTYSSTVIYTAIPTF